MLHTYHTGNTTSVTSVVEKVFPLIVENCSYLCEPWLNGEDLTRRDFMEKLERQCGFERLEYPASAAALLIAAVPCRFEPVTPSDWKRFSQKGYWSGIDTPFVLKITKHHTWRFFDEDGKTLIKEYQYRDIICDMMVERYNCNLARLVAEPDTSNPRLEPFRTVNHDHG